MEQISPRRRQMSAVTAVGCCSRLSAQMALACDLQLPSSAFNGCGLGARDSSLLVFFIFVCFKLLLLLQGDCLSFEASCACTGTVRQLHASTCELQIGLLRWPLTTSFLWAASALLKVPGLRIALSQADFALAVAVQHVR